MALFTLTDLKAKKEIHKSLSVSLVTQNRFAIGKVGSKIKDTIGVVSPGQSIHYVSMGDWSTHDLLFHFLSQTGPADVYFTTWAISEFAIRQLYAFVSSGLITKLSGIFDYRNGIHKPAELQFLKQITTNIKAAKCHAKVTVIQNESWGISIVTSANFTRNPRIEAGVICTDGPTAEFHKAWIMSELNNTSDFERDE
ncbi:MAG: hypothetical protein NT040_11140 [Bacteroidetes bacterium]|nr:hypothetical protein [Bacteroidota bacterium]